MDAFVAEDASLSHGADAEEVNNGSYRREDESDEEGQENKEENVMEEEEQLMMELQIHTSNTMTSEESSITEETSHEESTSFSKSEQHVTSSSIDNSEVDRLRELNERLGKTIASLENENKSLLVKVERLTKTKREISSMSLEQEKTNRAEDIKALEEKNKSLKETLTDLEESLEKESIVRMKAEQKLRTLEREKEDLKQKNERLEKNIKIQETTILKLQEMNITENEQTSKKVEININGGISADNVDGIGIYMAELRKNIFKNAKKEITDIERKYETQVEELKKTVDEKEAELVKARRENSEKIDDYELQILTLNERLTKAKARDSEEISRLEKEIQKSKEEINAIKQKTGFRSQTVKKTTKGELETELNVYKMYLDVLEGRFKKHETDESAGGVSEESTETMKKTETKTKIVEAYYDQEKIHHSQETERSVSQHEEAENQETKDSDGDDDSDEDSSDDGQKPGSPEEGQSESDPEADNQEDDQGRKDNDGDDDSDENNSTEIPLDMLEVPRDAIPRRQPRFAFIGTRSEFFEQ